MNNVIEELWCSYLCEASFTRSKEMKEAIKKEQLCEKRLLESLSDKDKALLEEYLSARNSVTSFWETIAVKKGIRFALNLIFAIKE